MRVSVRAQVPAQGATTKGIAIVNLRAYVVANRGVDAWAEMLAPLPREERETLEAVLAVGWYDLALYTRLLRATDAVVGCGDLGQMRPLGRYQAERDLTTIHRVFLRFASPAYAVEKTAELWRRYHDSGTWRVERPTPSSVIATLEGWGVVDPALCAVMTAYVGRLLELVGARDLHIEHARCRARGDQACVLAARWAP